jgi:hypothetical protein
LSPVHTVLKFHVEYGIIGIAVLSSVMIYDGVRVDFDVMHYIGIRYYVIFIYRENIGTQKENVTTVHKIQGTLWLK